MKIKKFILGILVTVYLIIAVFLTACLLTYNDYKISIFGDRSLIIVDNNEFEPDYKKGTLLIIQKNANDDIKEGDSIFFYNHYKSQVSVSYSKVTKTEKITDTETTYTITGDQPISSEYVIGKAATTKSIEGIGSIMKFMESRIGFILVIVFPIAVLFIYEIYVVVKEIVRPEKEEEKKEIKDEPKEEKPEEEKHEEVKEEKSEESHEEKHEEVKEEKAEESHEEKHEEVKEEPEKNETSNEEKSSESEEKKESESKEE